MIKKVAFASLPGGGKTTVAKHISQKFSYTFGSFGDGIRQCFRDVFEPKLNRPLDKAKDRQLLQYIGKYARTKNIKEAVSVVFEKEYCLNNNLQYGGGNCPFNGMTSWVCKIEGRLYGNLLSYNTTDFWIRHTFKQLENIELKTIDDCRWWHEFDKLKEEGYIIIRLNVSKETAEKRLIERDGGIDPKMWDSAGETQCNEFPVDYEIDAEQPLDKVLAEVEEIIRLENVINA